mgnify:CR=1 FL=1
MVGRGWGRGPARGVRRAGVGRNDKERRDNRKRQGGGSGQPEDQGHGEAREDRVGYDEGRADHGRGGGEEDRKLGRSEGSPEGPWLAVRPRYAAFLVGGWRGRGSRRGPVGRPGPGLRRFGGLAGVPRVGASRRNPRRTRAGVSRPGLRRYVGAQEIPRVLGGMGVSILSTSRGIMSGREAKKQNVGGELLAYIW